MTTILDFKKEINMMEAIMVVCAFAAAALGMLCGVWVNKEPGKKGSQKK